MNKPLSIHNLFIKAFIDCEGYINRNFGHVIQKWKIININCLFSCPNQFVKAILVRFIRKSN